jgi:hypothetical protein
MLCTHVCQWTESGRGTRMRCWFCGRCGTRARARGPSCRAHEVCPWTPRRAALTKEYIHLLQVVQDGGKVSRSHRAHNWKRKKTFEKIWVSHSGRYEGYCFLVYKSVYSLAVSTCRAQNWCIDPVDGGGTLLWHVPNINRITRSTAVGWGIMLQAGKWRVRFLMR